MRLGVRVGGLGGRGWAGAGVEVVVGQGWGAVGFGGFGTEILGILLIYWLIHMDKFSSKLGVFQFSVGQNTLLGGLTIIERS